MAPAVDGDDVFAVDDSADPDGAFAAVAVDGDGVVVVLLGCEDGEGCKPVVVLDLLLYVSGNDFVVEQLGAVEVEGVLVVGYELFVDVEHFACKSFIDASSYVVVALTGDGEFVARFVDELLKVLSVEFHTFLLL